MQRRPPPDDVHGPWCCAWELERPADIDAVSPPQTGQRTARVLVRLHGEPLGYLSAELVYGRLDMAALRRVAVDRFATGIRAHLEREGVTGVPARTPGPGPGCPTAPVEDRTVTVVVCSRARSELLRTCLERLSALTYPMLDVLVVDNAPLDDASRLVVADVTARDSRFAYLVEPRPGLSVARNCGLRHATGDVVAYTDDDVWVDPAWAHGLVRGFGRRSDVGCVTGLVSTATITSAAEAYFDARTTSWSARMTPDLFDLGQRDRGPLYPYSAGIFGTGANLAVDRRLMLDLGGFDEALGAGTVTNGGEDLDAFVRVLRAGRAIAYEPSALVWHHHRADDEALLAQVYGYGTGLSAFVTKYLADRATRPEVLRRVLQGVWRLGVIRRETADRMVPELARPDGATARELRGMLAGPLRYRRARRTARTPGVG